MHVFKFKKSGDNSLPWMEEMNNSAQQHRRAFGKRLLIILCFDTSRNSLWKDKAVFSALCKASLKV